MKTLACTTLLGLLLTTPTLTAASPDLNNDGLVGRADLAVMKSVFFSDDKRADLNGDGMVNFIDLALLRAAFDDGAPMTAINGEALPTISLLPANQNVDLAQSFTLEVWMDFTVEATIGGGFDVNYDPSVFAFDSWVPEDLGDPAFRRLPDTDVPGLLASFGFGDFNGLTVPALVGTLTFQAIKTANLDIWPSDTDGITGPFVSAVTFTPMTIDFGPANINVVDVPQPMIELTPETLDFPATQLFEEATLNLLVSNEGELDLSIGQIGAIDTITDPFVIITDECSETALAPMTSCELIVSFIPTDEGVATDSFDVPSDDPFRPSVIVSALGEGLPGLIPAIDVQPGSLEFAGVRLGQTGSIEMTISNLGVADLVLGQIDGLSTPFSIEADGCSSATLTPLNSCTVTAQFTPTELGLASDSIDLPSNDPDDPIVTVDLIGRGQTVGLVLTDAWALKARCRNLSAQEQQDFGVGAITIDCEEAGLVVDSGDRVSAVSFGTATGSEVGGLANGLEDQAISVTCRNTTTEQDISFTSNHPRFSCARRGLGVEPGDRLVLVVRGTAL